MSAEFTYDDEEFRDSIATVNADGSRNWIYPKKPKGKFYNYRTYVSWFLLAALIFTPMLKFNGEPLFLFNVIERKFILFGIVFTPQDMHMLALAMITIMVFIILFTVVFGRIFCGWVCPQTIFLEMVFRKIEYFIEGDANQQRKLNKAPWTTDKFIKKASKHIIFFSIAVLIANVFLSYIIGFDAVVQIISEPISVHWVGFLSLLVFSAVFYGVFAFMREQVCIAVCPYGRLQGVLLVKSSIVVVYDWIRGEPRGRIKKQRKNTMHELPVVAAETKKGDCIDCNLCVKVCPTGIDIRNGTQLECVNCTACMDACDEVMTKVGRQTGLIRYDSFENIEKGKSKLFNTRVLAYTGVLVTLLAAQFILFSNRSVVETLLLRTPGTLYQEVDDTYVSNLYSYQVVNKSMEDIEDVEFRLVDREGNIRIVGKVPTVPKQDMISGSLFIDLDRNTLNGRKTKVKLEVYSKGEIIDNVSTNFMGPIN